MASDVNAHNSPYSQLTSHPAARDSPQDSSFSRSACGECQRRKQKCDRGWPCNHCQKRKIPEKCNFRERASTVRSNANSSVNDQPSDKVLDNSSRKRLLSHQDSNSSFHDDFSDGFSDTDDSDDDRENLEALGYTSSHHFVNLTKSDVGLTTKNKKKKGRKVVSGQPQYYLDPSASPQLQRALQVLPPRPYTDALMQNFVKNVNFQYYIIYPHSFVEEYLAWWNDRADSRPLGVQWTCLLLMICACSAQYTDAELQTMLENDLSETTQVLTERYHNAARELYSLIPISSSHFLNVQQLLYSCFWYKSELRYVESWHALGAAIRQAQELGIHQEARSVGMLEFDREMRRRVWCVLDTWDWQISALLSRPLLINRAECDVQLPSLSLEGYSPSPLLHMKLQSQLIKILAGRFKLPKNVTEPEDVMEYIGIMDNWMSSFPPTHHMNTPDDSLGEDLPWLKLHRHYLHSMSYSMTLDPIRAYLTRECSRKLPPNVLSIRDRGIDFALKLMGALHAFFDHVWPRDAKFHFVLFAIFDTASVLCSSIIHDLDNSITREDEILAAIENAVSMLRRFQELLPSARLSYNLLLKFWKKAKKLSSQGVTNAGNSRASRKRQRIAEIHSTRPPLGASVESSVKSSSQSRETKDISVALTPELVFPDPSRSHSPIVGKEAEIGDGQPLPPPIIHTTIVDPNKSIIASTLGIEQMLVPDGSSVQPVFGNASSFVAPGYPASQAKIPSVETTSSEVHMDEQIVPVIWPDYHLNGNSVGFTMPPDQVNGAQLAPVVPSYDYNGFHNLPQPSYAAFDNVNGAIYTDGYDETNLGLARIMEDEASDLANLWDWRSLDLDFIPPPNGEPHM